MGRNHPPNNFSNQPGVFNLSARSLHSRLEFANQTVDNHKNRKRRGRSFIKSNISRIMSHASPRGSRGNLWRQRIEGGVMIPTPQDYFGTAKNTSYLGLYNPQQLHVFHPDLERPDTSGRLEAGHSGVSCDFQTSHAKVHDYRSRISSNVHHKNANTSRKIYTTGSQEEYDCRSIPNVEFQRSEEHNSSGKYKVDQYSFQRQQEYYQPEHESPKMPNFELGTDYSDGLQSMGACAEYAPGPSWMKQTEGKRQNNCSTGYQASGSSVLAEYPYWGGEYGKSAGFSPEKDESTMESWGSMALDSVDAVLASRRPKQRAMLQKFHRSETQNDILPDNFKVDQYSYQWQQEYYPSKPESPAPVMSNYLRMHYSSELKPTGVCAEYAPGPSWMKQTEGKRQNNCSTGYQASGSRGSSVFPEYSFWSSGSGKSTGFSPEREDKSILTSDISYREPCGNQIPDAATILASTNPKNKKMQQKLRPIIIDGRSVALWHGNQSIFSANGIRVCVTFFSSRGHTEITVFVPDLKTSNTSVACREVLDKLEEDGILKRMPTTYHIDRKGVRVISNDNRKLILQKAVEKGAVIISNDNFQELYEDVRETWRERLTNGILQFDFETPENVIFKSDRKKQTLSLEEILTM